MRVCCTPSTKNFRKSLLVSDETFHQKLSVPGPVMVLNAVTAELLLMAPLCAASTPSCETRLWPNHAGVPIVSQARVASVSKTCSNEMGVFAAPPACEIVYAWPAISMVPLRAAVVG